MDVLWMAVYVSSPSYLNSTSSLHILNSFKVKAVSYISPYLTPPPPQLASQCLVNSKSFKQICRMMTELINWLIDWIEWNTFTHLFPSWKDEIYWINPVLCPKAGLWQCFLPDPPVCDNKSGTQPFETSTLKFNLFAGYFLFTLLDPFSTLLFLALWSRRLNTGELPS